MTALARTPLYVEHVALGAQFTDFSGWEMPRAYGSELAEHRAVRERVGLFDVSHMGEISVRGTDAARFLNAVLVSDLASLAVGRARYSLLLQENGGIVDDLLCYRLADDRFLVVPNAGNTEHVLHAFEARARELRDATGFSGSVELPDSADCTGGADTNHLRDVVITDESRSTSLIALQGPNAEAVLAALIDGDLNSENQSAPDDLRRFSAVETTIAGTPMLLARTGYTGEDGFELYLPNDAAPSLWRLLLESGEPYGISPAGLAARDSLRLEAGLPLYGNELSRDTTPFEAGLGGVVSFTKPEDFPGRRALETAGDPARVLVGLKGLGRRAGRAGSAVLVDGETVGEVTSGQPSPTLGHPIALATIDRAYREPGTSADIDIRGTLHPAEVVPLPFIRRPSPATPASRAG